jgi:hypothetical protein
VYYAGTLFRRWSSSGVAQPLVGRLSADQSKPREAT